MEQNCWIYLKMKYTILIASVLLLILTKHVKALREDTMDSTTTQVNLLSPSFGSSSSGILKSHRGFSYPVNRNKTLIVTAPVGYSIMVAIRYIDLRPYNQDVLTLSSPYGVSTLKKYSNSDSFQHKKYYPYEEETYYVSSGNLAVTFTTGPSFLSAGFDGFELVYTVQGQGWRCSSGDFYCGNGRCIASTLTCDGHNHCGDRSSERNCFIPSRPGRTVGIAFGSFFVLIAILCGLYFACRRRFAVQSQTIVTSHPPPPTNIPSYPPSYPYSSSQYPPPPPAYSTGITNPTYH